MQINSPRSTITSYYLHLGYLRCYFNELLCKFVDSEIIRIVIKIVLCLQAARIHLPPYLLDPNNIYNVFNMPLKLQLRIVGIDIK